MQKTFTTKEYEGKFVWDTCRHVLSRFQIAATTAFSSLKTMVAAILIRDEYVFASGANELPFVLSLMKLFRMINYTLFSERKKNSAIEAHNYVKVLMDKMIVLLQFLFGRKKQGCKCYI